MERWREKELREEYFSLLWNKQKACGFGAATSNKELCDELDIEFNGPAIQICKSLQSKGLIDCEGFAWIHLTLNGREVAEEMDNQRWEERERERQLLQKLYEGRNNHPDDSIQPISLRC